ncbi:MAG: Unknown protein [uncultured Aureispira sp.]|uniref:Tetratricopeptide repeat protein n=1 Tax=uncultured Aureispira sp. TaxID=1331704 RepID=A0A6S6UFZ1_9BACT|nr:MAG: Unknown protein [uncultured Aureispira sp.]
MRLGALFCILYLSFYSNVLAQTAVDIEVEHFTDDMVTVATLDTNFLYTWNERVLASVKAFLSLEKGNHDVLILVTMPKGKPAFVEVSSRPQLKKETTDHLIRRIESLSRPPRSTLTEYAYLITASVGKGCEDPQLKFLPKVALPEEKVRAKYEAADLPGKIKLFQNWVIEDVIPVLAYYEDTFRTELRGVNSIGDILSNKAFDSISSNKLTIENSEYWRATMEVGSGDGLVILSKISIHIAKGEFDLAKRYLNVAQAFPEQNSMALNFYKQFDFRMEWLYDDVREQIRVGKKMQVEGDFEGAALHFEAEIDKFPKSADFNFEKYYSRSLLISEHDPEYIIKLWKDCKEAVYACDPLYNMNVPAKNSKDLYLMSKRHEINLLFDNQVRISENILEYADIALDLEVYGFAAHMYWLIIGNKPDAFPDRDILAHYLYCLEKLGDTENIRTFEEEYTRQKFKKIERERKEAMENSPVYSRSKGIQNKNNKRKKKEKKEKDTKKDLK